MSLKILRKDLVFKTVTLGFIAVLISSILCMTGIVWVAMGTSILVTAGLAAYIGYDKGTTWKQMLPDAAAIILGSQFAWCAYLI